MTDDENRADDKSVKGWGGSNMFFETISSGCTNGHDFNPPETRGWWVFEHGDLSLLFYIAGGHR